MGAQSNQTLNEITEIRNRLDNRIEELSSRVPPALEAVRGAAGVIAAVGGTSVVLGVLKKLRGRGKKPKATLPPNVNIQVLPSGSLPLAAVAVVVFAGLKVWEASRSKASVTPISTARR